MFLFSLSVAPVSVQAEERLVQMIRFHDYDVGSIDDWLIGKGFRFEQDAKKRDRLDLDIEDDSLVTETHRRSLALLPNEAINVPDFSFIEIDWGVRKHPTGAS